MRATLAWQSTSAAGDMKQVEIRRRELRSDDVAVRVDYCGVCHSDLHVIHMSDGGGVIPGHEFVGTVTEIGSAVARFAVGDRVAIGTIVDSCGECAACLAGQEVYCPQATRTYGGTDRVDGSPTMGGYSREYVVRETFAYAVPVGLDPAAAAPLLCAGITVWCPLREAGIGAGSQVAVAGLGGLGHLAVKLAVALGAEVTVLSRTADKADDARALGASDLVLTTDAEQLSAVQGRFDLILDTISAVHDLAPYLGLLAVGGTHCLLGYFGPLELNAMDLMLGGKKLSSSATGGRPRTQELLEFCADHGITADVEVVPSGQVDAAFIRLEAGDVRYRFVLDLADLN